MNKIIIALIVIAIIVVIISVSVYYYKKEGFITAGVNSRVVGDTIAGGGITNGVYDRTYEQIRDDINNGVQPELPEVGGYESQLSNYYKNQDLRNKMNSGFNHDDAALLQLSTSVKTINPNTEALFNQSDNQLEIYAPGRRVGVVDSNYVQLGTPTNIAYDTDKDITFIKSVEAGPRGYAADLMQANDDLEKLGKLRLQKQIVNPLSEAFEYKTTTQQF